MSADVNWLVWLRLLRFRSDPDWPTLWRKLAEAEGWDAVTTRRLSTEIEYSQPVLYKHFSSMDGVVAAVAVQGFGELADALSSARSGATDGHDALARVAHAFIGRIFTAADTLGA